MSFLIDRNDAALSVRQHLENKGYEASHSEDEYGVAIEIIAKRDKEMFIVEAIGESSHKDGDIVFALCKLLRKMNEQGFWIHYGIAMPRSYLRNYLKLLKDFEVVSFETQKIHVFLFERLYELTHLDPTKTIHLIQHLKAGDTINPALIDIGYPSI